jgi:hypothetical protein
MKRFRSLTLAAAIGMLALSSLTGCKTLLEEIGGMEGVERFNYALGPSLLADPAVSAFLNVAAVETVKKGIANEVAKASKAPPPNPGVNLRSFLAEKSLDKAAKRAFKASAQRAAQLAQLSTSATGGLMRLIDGVL